MEGLGFNMFWGFTPAINVFENVESVDLKKDEKPINILMSDTGGDMRHVLKTLCDILPMDKQREHPINIYYHE